MYKSIVTLSDLGAVVGVKFVSEGCIESDSDIKTSEYEASVLGCEYDSASGEFKDSAGKVKYTDPKKPKIKAAKKAKIKAAKLAKAKADKQKLAKP
jgi:hypothetical protein